jgi:hypothetical protein
MEEAKLQEICDAGLAPPAHHAYFDDPPLARLAPALKPGKGRPHRGRPFAFP